MSDYKLDNREEVIRVLQERVLSNAPLREIIRVYNEALSAALEQLGDADVVRSIFAAGYADIAEAFNLAEPPAPEATEGESTEG
jgi:hypothetical protein